MISEPVHLLDTSIIVNLLRRRPSQVIANRVRPLIAASRAAFNDVVRAELVVGCKTDAEIRLVHEWLAGLSALRVREGTWENAEMLGFALRRKGVTASLPDLLIASSAIEHGAVVMHVDGDFDTIALHSDLRIESYAEAQI